MILNLVPVVSFGRSLFKTCDFLMFSDPGRGKVIAPISRLKDANDQLTASSAVLVPLEEMQSFFLRHVCPLFCRAC